MKTKVNQSISHINSAPKLHQEYLNIIPYKRFNKVFVLCLCTLTKMFNVVGNGKVKTNVNHGISLIISVPKLYQAYR